MGWEFPVEALPYPIAKTVAFGMVAQHRGKQEGFQMDVLCEIDLVLESEALCGVVPHFLVSVFGVVARPCQILLCDDLGGGSVPT